MLMLRARSRESLTCSPLNAVMTSPASMPALAAGASGGSSRPSPPQLAQAEALGDVLVTGWTGPRASRVMLPLSMSSATTCLAGVPAGMSRSRCRRTARRREDRGVDADDIAVHVERRTAGIAVDDGGVGKDEVVVRTVTDVAIARGHDAGRHGATETEGIADRHHPVADTKLGRRIPESEILVGVDLDQREVGVRVGAVHLRRVAVPSSVVTSPLSA